MRCPSCNRENPPEARFCNACGAALEPQAGPASVAAEATHPASFQQYIPKDLADRIRSLGHHLESERRHVTVVFAGAAGARERRGAGVRAALEMQARLAEYDRTLTVRLPKPLALPSGTVSSEPRPGAG